MTQKSGRKGAPARPTKYTKRAGEVLSAPPSGEGPAAKIENLFKDWGGDYKTPGAAVLVMRDGKVLHEKGYGLIKVDGPERGPEIGPQTVFELASVSKQFTAMAVMLLEQKGKLKYTDTLSKYFKFRAPEAQEATILHLLNHRSGLPDYEDVFTSANLIDKHYPRSVRADRGRFEPTVDDVLKMLTEQYEFAFAPDLRYTYSNSGYVLLAKIIEEVSGKSYPAFMRERIFEPLGMNDTFVYSRSRKPPQDAALGYDRGWSSFNEIDYTPLDRIYGDGSIQSNLADMGKWVQAIDELSSAAPGGAGGGLPVTPETFQKALAQAQETDRTGVSYGFGWFIGKARGLNSRWHSGSWGGFKTMIMRFPDQKVTVVVLSNVAHLMPTFMTAKVATYYLEDVMDKPQTPNVGKKELARYAKRYTDENGEAYDVTLEPEPESDGRDALFLKYSSTFDKFKLVPVGENVSGEFFIEGLYGFDAFRYILDERRKIIKVPPRPKVSGRAEQKSIRGSRPKY
ncbi:MAG: beta-lactamase family protein [Acidobacteria bacterium]|nr:beta-lactamase family protein [Acidobacteriota bacterium]